LHVYSLERQAAIRTDIFTWLDNKLAEGHYELTREELDTYAFEGEHVRLLDTAKGIWNPKEFEATLTLMTSSKSPYEDVVGDDGLIHYNFQSRAGHDNIKVSRARELGVPIVYFQGIRSAVFTAHCPVYVVGESAAEKMFYLALDQSLTFFGDPLAMSGDQKKYAQRIVRQRLHQPVFRARVLHAYVATCAVCQLKHPELLDAAHIIEDSNDAGLPVVSNGLALCNLHHAAYDRNLLGISPDYKVKINPGLLGEIDGPMLKHGLQEMNERTIFIPKRLNDQPSKDALAIRFAEFVA
jgi:putative restriction endonuclease